MAKNTRRKLAAILAADVVGYSRLMGEDEAGTLDALRTHREELIEPKIAEHEGRVVKLMGDGLLAEFPSAVEAVQCAIEIQHTMAERNADVPEDRRITYRIGINIGDIIVEGDDIYGDGVNIAARLEGLAEPGGVCISRPVHTQIKGKLDLTFEHLGEKEVKNIAEPVTVYRVVLDDKAAAIVTPVAKEVAKPERRWWPVAAAAVAVLVLAVGGALWWQPWAPDVEPASVERMVFPLPEEPSIAVLPFDNMSGDPEQEPIADGFTESLITTLAQMPELFVIARNSTFTYKGKAVPVKQVAEELGVRYVLEGSVQREGDTLRIAAQLIDALEGHHLWADSFDRDVNAIFAVQDEIIQEIFTALQVELVAGEHGRVWRKGTDNFEAYLVWLQGWQHFKRHTKDDRAMARQFIQRAIDMDPSWAMPHTTLAWTHILDVEEGSDSPAESLRLAAESAQQALALDETYPGVYAALGGVHEAKGEIEQAIAYHEKAVALGPNISVYQAILAYNLTWAGRAEEAVPLLEKAMRLSPTYQAWYLDELGAAYNAVGRYEEAAEAYKQFLGRRPESTRGHTGLIVSYMWLGREDEAKGYAADLLRIKPKFSLESLRKGLFYKDQAYVERLFDALRKAGLPERSPLPLPDKPSIAVLPFNNMSDDPGQDYFADGMTEDLITDLSKISGLFVIARNSSFTYKGKTVDVKQVARELGVRYLLEGSVRRAGDQVRINAQLIDATTGGHLWANRYDGTLADIFVLQDRVTEKIVSALAVKLTIEDRKALEHSAHPLNLDAYEFVLRGRAKLAQANRQATIEARKLFEKAIEVDPKYARAYVNLGLLHYHEWRYWGLDRDRNMARALELAREAITLADASAGAHVLLALVLQWKGEHEAADREADQVLSMGGLQAETLGNLGGYLHRATRYREAVDLLERAIRLDPLHTPDWLMWLGDSYLRLEVPEKAAAMLEQGVTRAPNYVAVHLYLAMSYAMLDRMEEARAQMNEVLRINPKFSIEAYLRYVGQNIRYRGALERDAEIMARIGFPAQSRE